MSEPPPRKRFQIHLSTAIVLMFVAGALIWANVREHQVFDYHTSEEVYTGPGYGFPITAVIPVISYTDDGVRTSHAYQSFNIHSAELMLDIQFALVALIIVWRDFERRINRRASRKAP